MIKARLIRALFHRLVDENRSIRFREEEEREREKGGGGGEKFRRDFKFTPPVLRGYNLRIASRSLSPLFFSSRDSSFSLNLQIVAGISLYVLLPAISLSVLI